MSTVAEVKGRIASIDLLRGVAVLGILLINVQSFSMIQSAYFNPPTYGQFEGVNVWVWGFTRLFGDQKFMTLFSMLFGAGIILMSESALAAGRRPAAVHYRRMAVLLAIGLIHAYFLWFGDVLTFYALCGMVVYIARKWWPGILLGLGLCLQIVPPVIFAAIQYFLPDLGPGTIHEFEKAWNPDADEIARDLATYRGDYWGQMEHRVGTALEGQTALLLIWFGWRVSGLMLIGMALFKWKILGGYRSAKLYRNMFLVGCVTGLALEGAGMIYQVQRDWDLGVMIPGMQFNYWASLFMAAGYIGAVMLLYQARAWEWVQGALAKVGQMAFTNYLAQTLICTTIFYGHGLGLYGTLERWQQLLLVLAIWTIEIAWSIWWLKRFRHGPLEWLWRCATYLRALPLRKDDDVTGMDRVPPVLR